MLNKRIVIQIDFIDTKSRPWKTKRKISFYSELKAKHFVGWHKQKIEIYAVANCKPIKCVGCAVVFDARHICKPDQHLRVNTVQAELQYRTHVHD